MPDANKNDMLAEARALVEAEERAKRPNADREEWVAELEELARKLGREPADKKDTMAELSKMLEKLDQEREEELQPGEELVLTTQPSANEPGTVEVRSTAESSGAPVVDRVYSKIAFHMAESISVANYNDEEEKREARSVEIEGDNGQIIRQNDRVLSLSTTTCPQ